MQEVFIQVDRTVLIHERRKRESRVPREIYRGFPSCMRKRMRKAFLNVIVNEHADITFLRWRKLMRSPSIASNRMTARRILHTIA